jgi:hypothetical protein
MSEARPTYPRAEDRLGHLEKEVGEVTVTLARLEPVIIRIDERLNSTLSHLATKTETAVLRSELRSHVTDLRSELKGDLASLRLELETKPGKLYLITAVGVLLLAALAALPVITKLVGGAA